MYFRGAGTNVIRDGQSSPPTLRCYRTLERREQRFRVRIGDWQHWDPRDRFRILNGKSLCVSGCAHTGRKWIARIIGIHNTSPLHAETWTPAAGWIVVAFEVAIPFGVGINDATDGAVFGCHLRFYSAPPTPISHNDDRYFVGSSQPIELLVVFTITVVHVHKRSGYVAVNRVSVIGGKLLRCMTGSGIDGQHWLLQLGNKSCGLQQFEDPLFRRRKQNIERLDMCVKPPFFEFRKYPLGIVLVIR